MYHTRRSRKGVQRPRTSTAKAPDANNLCTSSEVSSARPPSARCLTVVLTGTMDEMLQSAAATDTATAEPRDTATRNIARVSSAPSRPTSPSVSRYRLLAPVNFFVMAHTMRRHALARRLRTCGRIEVEVLSDGLTHVYALPEAHVAVPKEMPDRELRMAAGFGREETAGIPAMKDSSASSSLPKLETTQGRE